MYGSRTWPIDLTEDHIANNNNRIVPVPGNINGIQGAPLPNNEGLRNEELVRGVMPRAEWQAMALARTAHNRELRAQRRDNIRAGNNVV